MPINLAECIARLNRAFQSGGWSNITPAPGGAYAYKGDTVGHILCATLPDGHIVTVFTAGTVQNEVFSARVQLQQAMETGAPVGGPPPPPPTGGGPPPGSGTAQEPLSPPQQGYTFQGGTNLRWFGITVRNDDQAHAICRAECAKDPRCRAYAYVRIGGYTPGAGPVCYLMANVPNPVPNSCC